MKQAQRRVRALFVVTVTMAVASVAALVIVGGEEPVARAAPASATAVPTTTPLPTTTEPPPTTLTPTSPPTTSPRARSATVSRPRTIVPPPANVPPSTDLASPNGEVATYDAPAGEQIGKVGLWYRHRMTMPILEDRGEWLRIMMPERPNGLTAWVKADSVTRSTSPWRMILMLRNTRLYVYKDGSPVWSAPVGIGRDGSRTPNGSFFVAVIEKPGQRGYGPVVLTMNAHSEHIKSWDGRGDALAAFHGPFGAEGVIRSGGGKVSNGCVRMLTEDQLKMDGITRGTPVDIIS